MNGTFKRTERDYGVETLRYGGEQVWSYLRTYYFWHSIRNITGEYALQNRQSLAKKGLKALREAFYGFSNWFRRYDYLVFSNTQSRFAYRGIYREKAFEELITLLGEERCLYIDLPNPDHLPRNRVSTKRIVSKRLLDLTAGLFILAAKRLGGPIEIPLLDTINRDNATSFDYASFIRAFNVRKRVYRFLFSLYRPKAVFVSCYDSDQAILKAASELGIKTIEAQHSAIGSEHFAYNLLKPLDPSYFPDVLLAFGEYDRHALENTPNNPIARIYPVGRYQLELMAREPVPEELLDLGDKYRLRVSVSTQYTVEKKLALFIRDLARIHRDIVFMFSLRHFDRDYYEEFGMGPNVYLFKDEYSCYDVMRASDIHMTCYSTCAQEALFFGKIAILADIDALATNFMGSMKSPNIRIVRDAQEFAEAAESPFAQEVSPLWATPHTRRLEAFIQNEIRN